MNLLIVLLFWGYCQATSIPICKDNVEINYQNVIFEYELENFSFNQYHQAVNELFAIYENKLCKKIVPGTKRRVGLKVYTSSGAGLSTPKALVAAVINQLEARGFTKNEIFIIDEDSYNLRLSGFLPPLSHLSDTFEGVKVHSFDENNQWDEDWHYISSLPSRQAFSRLSGVLEENKTKSFLPVTLITDTDFWINLPVITSHEFTGVSGALTNATIFNIDNNKRFLNSPIHAAIAIAEIAAIPEFQESLIFTLVSLESYQFIDGAHFNARYTKSEPILWLSVNAPGIDYLMYQKINHCRKNANLPVFEQIPYFFAYCKNLNVGDYKDIRIVKLK